MISKQAIESLAKEMYEDVITLGPSRSWETASEGTKAAYRKHARLVLQHPERR
jgi:hypothetical protein